MENEARGMEEVGVVRPGKLLLFSCPFIVDRGEAP